MAEISTAEEFWFKNTGQNINQEEYSAMIEFAKFHVEQALKAAAKSAKFSLESGKGEVHFDVYPLTNIK